MTTATPDPLACNWLKAPDLCAWLERHGLTYPELQLGNAKARRFRQWRKQEVAHIYAADNILTHLGFHLSELPDELFTDKPPRKRTAFISQAQKAEAVRRYRAGERATDLAAELGCERRCISRWAKKERELAA